MYRGSVEAAAREFTVQTRFCGYGEVFQRPPGERCDIVVVECGSDSLRGLAVLKQVVERMPRIRAIVASADTSVATIRGALEAGAVDVLSLPLSAQELHKTFIKLSQTTIKTAAMHAQPGNILTIYGVRGGLGATTIAVNLAFQLAGLTEADTGLVDLDLQRGDVAAFLNVTPLNSLATLAAARGPVDEIFLAGTLTRHQRGVFVLPAPQLVEEADTIAHDHVQLALQLMRTQFRFTVVDTPRTIGGPTLAAFEECDRVLILTDLSVPSVRAARRTYELLLRLNVPVERLAPIFTHAVPGPVSPQDAARAVGKEPIITIPRDDAAAASAMNGGVPLNGKVSALSNALAELAAKLAGTPPPSRGRGLLQRVFGKEARK